MNDPEIPESVFRRAYFLVVFGFLVSDSLDSTEFTIVSTLAMIFALACSITGCALYARQKGLSWKAGLLGLLPFLGFFFVMCIEAPASEEPADTAGESVS